MTRLSAKTALVLDGNQVKLRLQAERLESQTMVHVDTVRWTVRLRNAPPFLTDKRAETTSVWDDGYRLNKLLGLINELPDHERNACGQASDLADRVCMALGFEFSRGADLDKGHDFYKRRWPILRESEEVGWVCFGASSESPKQRVQAESMHVYLYGKACTFAIPGWPNRIADLIDEMDGSITRTDLALDFFDGYTGGIERVAADYDDGLCDVYGKRPKLRDLNWKHGASRSLYLGSKSVGKETNIYEKGDQLFGEEVGSDWLRFELRYGNKMRVIDSDILRRPADFFAGASDWHAAVLREAGDVAVPEQIHVTPPLALMTVKAECTRNALHVLTNAAPSIALAFQYLTEDQFLELVTHKKRPKRLASFSHAELSEAYSAAFAQFVVPRSGPVAMSLH